MGYTWDRFIAYRRLAARREAQALHERLLIGASAARGGEQLPKMLAALRAQADAA